MTDRHIHTYMHTCTDTYRHTYMHTYTDTYIYIHTSNITCIYIYIYIYMHTHTHTHASTNICRPGYLPGNMCIHRSICLATYHYLSTYHLPTYLPTYLPTCLPTFLAVSIWDPLANVACNVRMWVSEMQTFWSALGFNMQRWVFEMQQRCKRLGAWY